MRPPAVLDHQAALIDYLGAADYGRYLDRFGEDMVKTRKFSAINRGVADVIRTSLRVAQAFHVQADMMPLLRAASMDLDPLDYLVHERIPAEHGFLIFEDGWVHSEVWGRTATINALQWWHGGAPTADHGTTVPGIWLVHYNDTTDERDETTRDLFEKHGDVNYLGRFHVTHMSFLPYEQRLGPTSHKTDTEYAQYALNGQTLADEVPNTDRMVVGLFRLLTQVLVEVKDAPLDRATMRRAKRMNLPQRVQTIKLRRKDTRFLNPSEPGAAPVEWQHSWVVRGHWAWRKCGAEHPLAEPYEHGHHARVYIAPYFKGPEDAPLRVSEKVWDLAR